MRMQIENGMVGGDFSRVVVTRRRRGQTKKAKEEKREEDDPPPLHDYYGRGYH
jgi:hypothetical protein